MPAYNFQPRFIPNIMNDRKRQTIRPRRKRGNPQPGSTLYLYTGIRTKKCQKLNEVICKSVDNIIIDANAIYINGQMLTRNQELALAINDGFDSIEYLYAFFFTHYGFPFKGLLIKW